MLIKKAPAVVEHPGARTTRRSLMATTRILQNALTDEVKRTILREATERYHHELMGVDEGEVLWNRILRLRRQLKIA